MGGKVGKVGKGAYLPYLKLYGKVGEILPTWSLLLGYKYQAILGLKSSQALSFISPKLFFPLV